MELTAKKIREMSREEKEKALESLRETLLKERASVAMGGAPKSPGLMRSVKRQIARLLTIMAEEEINE